MKFEYITISSNQTKKTGEILARNILKPSLKDKALILSLEGDLGGGKTTFLQGFARGLGIKEKILSPTFVIMRKFKIQNPKSKFKSFYHIDCYRVEEPEEILNFDFKRIIKNSKNIVAIEWADRIRRILPPKSILVNFAFVGKNKRKIVIK